MVVLRALMLGDIATLQFPAPSGCGHRVEDELEGRRGLGNMLKQSFGKVSEVHSAQDVEPAVPSQQPAASAESGLRCLQLSLEEAFYLAHVDGCLALAVRPVVFPTPGATALPSPKRRKRRLGDDEQPQLAHHHHLNHEGSGGDGDGDGAGSAARGKMFGASLGFNSSGGSGCTDAGQVLDGDAAPLLSSQEAWQYCCNRRPGFPAMFAVYRHFRARGYTVRTGHKYGAHFVLYEGPPDECHSRYCVHVAGGGGGDSWGHMKTVTRLMPDIAKCLLVCGVRYHPPSSLLDTSSLAALETADVTALRFSRSRDEPDGEGRESPPPTSLKAGKRADSASRVEKPAAKKRGKTPPK